VVCPCCGGRLLSLCLVFLLEDKSETFGFVQDLIVRLKNERHGNAIQAIHSDNGSEFKNSRFDAFCRDLGLEH
jgi:transposase InsO family protein